MIKGLGILQLMISFSFFFFVLRARPPERQLWKEIASL
jgi:hypothetical protein